jgi:hypothetical protein
VTRGFFDFVDQLVSQIEKVDDVHPSYHENGRYAEYTYKAATAWPLVVLKKALTNYVTKVSEILAKFRTAVLGLLPEPDAVVVAANPGPITQSPSEGLLDTGAASTSAAEQGVPSPLHESCASAEDSPPTAEPAALADADKSPLLPASAPVGRDETVGSTYIPSSP